MSSQAKSGTLVKLYIEAYDDEKFSNKEERIEFLFELS